MFSLRFFAFQQLLNVTYCDLKSGVRLTLVFESFNTNVLSKTAVHISYDVKFWFSSLGAKLFARGYFPNSFER